MNFTILSLSLLASFILGLSKAGLKGLGIIVVAIIASCYGAKASTGILVPLFIVGDILAVVYYNRFAKWKYLVRFLPAMALGVIFAVWLGKDLDEKVFKYWMASIILISVVIIFYRDIKKDLQMPKSPIFALSMGLAAGFATMIGNVAGAFSNMYFLATKLPKNEIIATSAWLFFIINIFKVPFHVFSWQTINRESLVIDLYLFPAVICGFAAGVYLVKLINESWYRKFLLGATTVGAILIFF